MEKSAVTTLKKLSEAFGPSTREDEVISIIKKELEQRCTFFETPHKNLIAVRNRPGSGKTIMFQAHTDEVGLRPFRYQPDGFVELTPMGGIPPEASNQVIIFWPTGVKGILVTLRGDEKTKCYVDIGAKDADEALRMIPYHSNGAYFRVELEESSTHFMGKSFDDRAGCSAIISAINSDFDSSNRIIAAFTAREETGNWPSNELYRILKDKDLYPDLIVNVECCPGGPTPGNPHPLAEVGRGIVLVNMDASYEPDALVCKVMEDIAEKSNIPNQLMAVRDGSGELGRLALGFGVPGYPLIIPCRYMHFPHSVISKSDYSASIRMIMEIARQY